MTSKVTKAKKKAIGEITGAELIRRGELDEFYYLADWEEMAQMKKKNIREGYLAFLREHEL